MLLCTFKVLLVWGAMMFIGTNLLGFVVRGILEGAPIPPEDERSESPVLQREYQKFRVINVVVTLGAAGATAAYLWALNQYFGGPLMVVAAAMLMISRIPDLVTEIRTGKPTTRETMTRRPFDYVMSSLTFVALPVAWFALCSGS